MPQKRTDVRRIVGCKFVADPRLTLVLKAIETLGKQNDRLIKEVKKMAGELDALTAQVAATKTVVDSAITLIAGLRQAIIDAGTDPAKLQALTDELAATDKALADAVATPPTP